MRRIFYIRHYVRMAVLVRRIGCKVCGHARYAPHNPASLLGWQVVVLVVLTLMLVFF